MKNFGTIYKITDLNTNKVYIGQTLRSVIIRVREHKKENKILCDVLKSNCKIEELFTAFDSEILNTMEKYYIILNNSLFPDGFNLKHGGVIGSCHSELSRYKNSRSLGGKPVIAINVKNKTYKIYLTQHQTAKDGFDVRNVNLVLKNKRLTHKGYIFKYLNHVNQNGSDNIKEISHVQRLVVEPSYINLMLEEYNTTTSDRHPSKVKRQAKNIINLFNKGYSGYTIAKKLDINKKSVLKFLKQSDLGRTHMDAQRNRWMMR